MNGIGEGIGRMLFGLMGLCLLMLPLAVWKAVEIVIWVWAHVHFGAQP